MLADRRPPQAELSAVDGGAARRVTAVGQGLCLAGATLGAAGLLGAITGTSWLTTLVPGQPSMVPNTALGLLLIGVAGAVRRLKHAGVGRRALSLAASVVVLAIGVGTLVEYGLGLALSLDQVLIGSDVGPFPGRPSPPTALALTFLGAALILFDARPAARARPSEWLALSAGLIAFTATQGQLFGAGALYRLEDMYVVGVAVPTALSLLLTSLGVLLERPDAGLMCVVVSPGPGGVLMRRLTVAAVLGPVLLGVILTRVLAKLGIEEFALVYATLTVAATVVALSLLYVTAVPLDRMHGALESSRARTQELIDHAADGIFMADLSARYTDVNSAGCRMLGYTREEIVGKTIDDLVPPEHIERLSHHKERLLAGDTEVGEWLLRRKDGTYLPVEVSARILPDGRWHGFVRDISERRRRETEQSFLAEVGAVLASSLDYQDTLTSIAELAVRSFADACVVDVVEAGGEMRRLRVVSRDPSKAWACELLMRLPVDRKRPHMTASARDTGRTVLMSRMSPEMVASFAQSEEHLRTLRAVDPRSLIAVPLIAHGKLLGVIAFLSSSRAYGPQDIHLAEEIAQRAAISLDNARLYLTTQRAVQARDDVLGIVVHDLRNPLGVILMQAGLLRRQSERGSRCVEVIQRAANQMNHLIQDLLDVTCMEAGQLSVERRRVVVAQVLADSMAAQSALASSASLELTLDVVTELPDVSADRYRVLQVFENLIGNAIKFTEAGGRITVGARLLDLEVKFWVADTGAGIPAEDLPYLFDRFWQAQKAERCGAGLGLHIVKGIVEAHGGRIWVESAPGRGSCFFFTIPAAPAQVGAQPGSAGCNASQSAASRSNQARGPG